MAFLGVIVPHLIRLLGTVSTSVGLGLIGFDMLIALSKDNRGSGLSERIY